MVVMLSQAADARLTPPREANNSREPKLEPVDALALSKKTILCEVIKPKAFVEPLRKEVDNSDVPILNNIKQYLHDRRASFIVAAPQHRTIFNDLHDSPKCKGPKLINCRPMPLSNPRVNNNNNINNNNNYSITTSNAEGLLNSCDYKAMRYYRIWIYTCNAVLMLAVLAFCIAAGKLLVNDYRRHLIPHLTLHQPSLVYAYLALLAQSGLLQAVGCLGALRLNERLLNVYWLSLLLLLLGDAVVGIYWIFRFEMIRAELRPALRERISTNGDYGTDTEFTELWDRLQREYSCCGVIGEQDFLSGNRSRDDWNTPISCCGRFTTQLADNATRVCHAPNMVGCEEKLLSWLKQTADVLFVLGYCVIAFLKLCFLGILRYEIKEMIQKIKILQSELNAELTAELGVATSPNHVPPPMPATVSTVVPIPAGLTNVNGGPAHNLEQKMANRSVRQESAESEREALLAPDLDPLNQTPVHPSHLSHDNLKMHHNRLFGSEGAAEDSDSNSHCPLLSSELPTSTPKNVNGNNNHEMRELQETTKFTGRRMVSGSAATRI